MTSVKYLNASSSLQAAQSRQIAFAWTIPREQSTRVRQSFVPGRTLDLTMMLTIIELPSVHNHFCQRHYVFTSVMGLHWPLNWN